MRDLGDVQLVLAIRSRVIHKKIKQFAKIESYLYCYLSRDIRGQLHRAFPPLFHRHVAAL